LLLSDAERFFATVCRHDSEVLGRQLQLQQAQYRRLVIHSEYQWVSNRHECSSYRHTPTPRKGELARGPFDWPFYRNVAVARVCEISVMFLRSRMQAGLG
jgi:hypothetical protein